MAKKLILALIALPVLCIAMIIFAGLIGIASFFVIKYFIAAVCVLAVILIVREYNKQ